MIAHVRFAALLTEGRIFTFTLDFDAWPTIDAADSEEAIEEANRRARAGRPLMGSFALDAPHDCSRDHWTVIQPVDQVLAVVVLTENGIAFARW